MTTVKIVLQGPRGGIPFRALATAADNAYRLLGELDALISETHKRTMDWLIKDISAGSVVLEVEARVRPGARDLSERVAHAYVGGLAQVKGNGTLPPYWTDTTLKRAMRLVDAVQEDGATALVLSHRSESVELSRDVGDQIAKLAEVKRRTIGSIDGKLETISIHGSRRFVVYLHRTGRAVTCKMASDELLEPAKQAMGRRVNVSGEILANARGDILRVEATRIRVLRTGDQLPPLSQIGGMDPDFTGGLSSEEYVRGMRDG